MARLIDVVAYLALSTDLAARFAVKDRERGGVMSFAPNVAPKSVRLTVASLARAGVRLVDQQRPSKAMDGA